MYAKSIRRKYWGKEHISDIRGAVLYDINVVTVCKRIIIITATYLHVFLISHIMYVDFIIHMY